MHGSRARGNSPFQKSGLPEKNWPWLVSLIGAELREEKTTKWKVALGLALNIQTAPMPIKKI